MSVPNIFANQIGPIPLSELDVNFQFLIDALATHELDTTTHGTTGNIVGTSDVQTLTNKTFDLANNSLTGTLTQFNAALTGADFASLAGAEVLTNKTFALGSNALTGTLAQFNTACTDADFAFVGQSNSFSVSQVINVTDNTNAALRVTQLGTGNALLIEDSTNPDATPFVVDANGNVIQGHTVTVNIGGTTPRNQIHSSTVAASSVTRWSADSIGPMSILSKSRSATIGSFSAALSGDVYGIIQANADDGTDMASSAAQIAFVADGAASLNSTPGYISLRTTPNANNASTERMRISADGHIGIGGAAAGTNAYVRLLGNLTGATTIRGIQSGGAFQSDVTSTGTGFTTINIGTQAATFTLGTLLHYEASQGTIGAGSTVTNQIGFQVQSTLTGGTNNYGFRSDLASASNVWAFYGAGTAQNAFAGNTRIGSTVAPVATLDITGVQVITANSASAALTVTQTGSGNSFVVEDATSPDSTPFVIDTNGVVVAGHTAAVADAFTAMRLIQSLSTTGSAGFLTGRYSADANSAAISFNKSRNTTIGSQTAVVSGDFLGRVSFAGSDGTTQILAAEIQALVDGTPGTNDMPGRLVFSTTPDGTTTPVEGLRISNSQQVLATGNGGLGYGVGAGGAVTQITSKATAVTLNKPAGQITMNNAALNAGASVTFIVNNTVVTGVDTVIACLNGGVASTANYRVEVENVGTSLFRVRVTNLSAGSLSEAAIINFSVHKGSIS